MKKLIVSAFIYLGISLCMPVMAQRGNKRIEVLKIEFITQKLNLSPEEAQKFWPVYNNYQREMNALFAERRQARMAQRETGVPPDDLKFESKILELKKRYRKEFLDALPSQKADMIFPAEREFRERLINQLRERREHP